MALNNRRNSARPDYVALAVLAVQVVVLLLLLAPRGFDASVLVRAGHRFVDEALAPESLRTLREGDGYDGQFNYRLALDPLTAEQTANGISLDLPEYRQQRILYPLLAWAVLLGSAAMVPWALLVINLIAVTALVFVGASVAQQRGCSPWWGAVMACTPSVLIGLAADVAEPVALFAAVAGVGLVLAGAVGLAAVTLSLGVLAHEAVVVIPLALALSSLATSADDDGYPRPSWALWAGPLAVFVGWQALLTLRWGETPLKVANGFVGEPLRGMASSARQLLPPGSTVELLMLIEIAAVLAFSAAVFWSLRTTRSPGWVCLAWIFATALAFMGNGTVWSSDWSFWRSLVLAWGLGLLILIESRTIFRLPVAALSLALWAVTAVRFVWAAGL